MMGNTSSEQGTFGAYTHLHPSSVQRFTVETICSMAQNEREVQTGDMVMKKKWVDGEKQEPREEDR